MRKKFKSVHNNLKNLVQYWLPHCSLYSTCINTFSHLHPGCMGHSEFCCFKFPCIKTLSYTARLFFSNNLFLWPGDHLSFGWTVWGKLVHGASVTWAGVPLVSEHWHLLSDGREDLRAWGSCLLSSLRRQASVLKKNKVLHVRTDHTCERKNKAICRFCPWQ